MDFEDSFSAPSAALPAEAAAGLSTRWAVQRKHEATYTDSGAKVEVSPLTGNFVACWCSGDVSLLCLSTGALLNRIAAGSEEAEEQFSSFSISPDERTLATVARRSRMIQIWDIATGAQLATWKAAHALPVLDLAFSPSGAELASCAADKSIIVYSVRRAGLVTHRFAPSPAQPQKGGHRTRVTRIFWHPSVARAQLVSCAEDGEMRIWSLKDSSSVLLANHMAQVAAVAFTRDGDTLISGGRDKVVNVWNVAVGPSFGAHQRTLPVYESVEGLVVLQQRPTVVTEARKNKGAAEVYFTVAGSKGVLRTWALSTLECVHEKALPTAAAPPSSQGAAPVDDASMTQAQRNASKYIANQVAHLLHLPAQKASDAGAPRPERLIAVSQEQNFYVYAAATFTRVQLLLGFNDEIIDLKAHPNNTHALMAANSSQVRVVHLETFAAELLSGHTDTVLAIDVSPCGQWVVSCSKDCTVRFWRLHIPADGSESTSECVAVGEGHTESIGCVSFSRNRHTGKLFAVSGARERILKLWDCDLLKSHTPGNPPLRLTSKVSKLAHDKDINCVEVAPNDKLIASGSEDKLIRIWDSSELAPKGVLKGHRRGVWSVKFSPVDKVLASGSGDKTIKLWSMDDFTCLKTLESHTASVKQVHFISSGMQLLSSGDDSVVKLWTIASSECVNTFPEAHEGKIWAMAVTKDGKNLITGGSDSVLAVWTDVSAQDVEVAAATRENFLLQEQQLNNLVRTRQWKKAVKLCLALEQPRKCFTILQELLLQETASRTPVLELTGIVAELGAEPTAADEAKALGEDGGEPSSDVLLTRMLLYIRDWNTHAKSAHVAQSVLAAILRTVSPARLLANRTLLQQANALNLYAERHFARIDKLLTKSFIMDHMLASMHAYEPDQSTSSDAQASKPAGEGTSDAVLKALLASSSSSSSSSGADGSGALASTHPRVVKAAAATPAAAPAPEADDEEGFDDDESAWATNWKAGEGEESSSSSSSEEEEGTKKPAAKPAAKKMSGKGASASPAAAPAPAPAKSKRKQPASEEEPAMQPAVTKKARASPALKPAPAPAAAAAAPMKEKKKGSKKG